MARKKRYTETVRVDAERLRAAIENHGYTAKDLGLKLGYSEGYFWAYTNGAKEDLPVRVVTLLDLIGIHLNEYEYQEPEISEEPEDDPLPWDIGEFEERLLASPSTVILSSESIEELCKAMHETIYSAVYEAMKKVWGTN